VVPRDELAAAGRALALRLSASAPLALAAIKRLLRSSLQRSLTDQLNEEQHAFIANSTTADFHEALAAFVAKRPPRFEGR